MSTHPFPPRSHPRLAHPRLAHPRLALLAVVTVAAGLSVGGCADAPEAAAKKPEPVKVEKIPDTDLKRMTLEATAAERIGIQTHTVDESPAGTVAAPITVPYGAVLYDAKGATYVYTNPEPRVFVRHPITVDRIDGPWAMLTAGPPLGTQVVTVGGSELAGIEFGVGK